jgi:SEC-C motif-containing protein
MNQLNCYCGSNQLYKNCCLPYINQIQKAPTALALMRSRYTAYATQAIDYIVETTQFSQQKDLSKAELYNWSKGNDWQKLEILHFSDTIVEFKAYYKTNQQAMEVHHEQSLFEWVNGQWYYVSGIFID